MLKFSAWVYMNDYNTTIMSHHSKIFIRATHFKCSFIESKHYLIQIATKLLFLENVFFAELHLLSSKFLI